MEPKKKKIQVEATVCTAAGLFCYQNGGSSAWDEEGGDMSEQGEVVSMGASRKKREKRVQGGWQVNIQRDINDFRQRELSGMKAKNEKPTIFFAQK